MDQIDIAKRLTHITFIMDGNGRWAKERNKSRSYGHRAGVKRIRPIVDECFFKYGINTVSLFVFSKENWKRDKKEISYLFSLLKAFFKTNIKDLIEKGVRMHVSGDLEDERIPPSVKKVILDAIKLSENNDKFHFNILFNYGGQQEIVHCFNSIIKKMKENNDYKDNISEEEILKNLYCFDLPPVDLLVRTSGEKRISNCLLYEIAYAEFIFNDKYWPDYDDVALSADLDEFLKRKRRFGGVV